MLNNEFFHLYFFFLITKNESNFNSSIKAAWHVWVYEWTVWGSDFWNRMKYTFFYFLRPTLFVLFEKSIFLKFCKHEEYNKKM